MQGCKGQLPGKGLEERGRAAMGREYPASLHLSSGCLSGVMAGFNMGGDLREPADSVPLGTLAAVGIS